MVFISPSILSADFSILAEEAAKMKRAGADLLHIDVMDGHFVPNLTFGAPVIRCLRDKTDLPFDVHLMIEEPQRYIGDFVKAGADLITFHVEAKGYANDTLDMLEEAGVKKAISVKPGTPVESIFPYLERLDMVLIMTVEPGFGGQKFRADMLPKIEKLRAEIENRHLPVQIQVDGGISKETAPLVAKAGATVLVAGSALFLADDPVKAVAELRNAAQGVL